jgi:hypothetical protein
MGSPEVMKHFRAKELEVRLQCTLILYLHERTSIENELRFHRSHLYQFIVHIPQCLTFVALFSVIKCVPLSLRNGNLKQHPSDIATSLSFKHLIRP